MDGVVRAAVERRGLGLAFLGAFPWLAWWLPDVWLAAAGLLMALVWLALVRADQQDAEEARQSAEMRELYEVAEWRGLLARHRREKGGVNGGNGKGA